MLATIPQFFIIFGSVLHILRIFIKSVGTFYFQKNMSEVIAS